MVKLAGASPWESKGGEARLGFTMDIPVVTIGVPEW